MKASADEITRAIRLLDLLMAATTGRAWSFDIGLLPIVLTLPEYELEIIEQFALKLVRGTEKGDDSGIEAQKQ